MDVRAAVAHRAGTPLTIETVRLELIKNGFDLMPQGRVDPLGRSVLIAADGTVFGE